MRSLSPARMQSADAELGEQRRVSVPVSHSLHLLHEASSSLVCIPSIIWRSLFLAKDPSNEFNPCNTPASDIDMRDTIQPPSEKGVKIDICQTWRAQDDHPNTASILQVSRCTRCRLGDWHLYWPGTVTGQGGPRNLKPCGSVAASN